jgi:putative transcriptional regulator
MKAGLLDKIGIFLLKEGFTVKTLTRTCFDILARNQDKILLVKVLEDANSVSGEYTDAMKSIAAYIDAVPIILSEKAGDKLRDNVLYLRFGVYTLNLNTFQNSIKNKYPYVKRTQAGYTVSLEGGKLRKRREEKGLSLKSISQKIGVSSGMLNKYEKGTSEVTLNKAMKIHNLFGSKVFKQIDLFSQDNLIQSRFSSNLARKYIDLGFEATDTSKTPFDIISKKDNELILTSIGDKANPNLDPVSKLLEADSLIIFKKKKPKNLPSMTKEDFLEFEKANELIKFLKEN